MPRIPRLSLDNEGQIWTHRPDSSWQQIGDGEGGGISDHGQLTGLADDDHGQYHTDVRADARYWPLSTDLATQAELDAVAVAKANTAHAHSAADIISGTLDDARIPAGVARDVEVTTAITTHEAAADPHTGYQRESEKGATGGYASLDGGGTVPDAQIPAGITRDTELAVHEADTTGVHGIADTAALETVVGAQAKVDAHVNDAVDAHDASAVSFTPAGTIAATDVQAAIEEVAAEAGGGGAPTTADYLVGTVQAGLSAEVVVGTSPGGELGGSWASPTVDSVHSGSSHVAVQTAAEATAQAALDAHLNDTSDAHDASAISILDAAADFAATEVEGALAELQSDHEADATALSDHIADASAAHAASAISVVSTTLSGVGTDVQAVFEEIDNLLDDHSGRHENGGPDEISITGLDGAPVELTNHLNDTVDAHDASAISVLDAGGNFAATEVEGVLAELDAAIAAGGIPGTIVDAKGDIIVATAADIVARKAVGANGTWLKADSGQVDGLIWSDLGMPVVKQLGADLTLTTTHAKATNLDMALGVGTWMVDFRLVYRSDTATIGCVFGVNFSGTQTTFVMEGTQFEATTAASTGAADQVHATFGLRSGGAQRTPSNTAAGATVGSISVDTVNADMLVIIRGLVVVTVAGNIEIWGSKEAAGTGVQTLKASSSAIAWKIA